MTVYQARLRQQKFSNLLKLHSQQSFKFFWRAAEETQNFSRGLVTTNFLAINIIKICLLSRNFWHDKSFSYIFCNFPLQSAVGKWNCSLLAIGINLETFKLYIPSFLHLQTVCQGPGAPHWVILGVRMLGAVATGSRDLLHPFPSADASFGSVLPQQVSGCPRVLVGLLGVAALALRLLFAFLCYTAPGESMLLFGPLN